MGNRRSPFLTTVQALIVWTVLTPAVGEGAEKQRLPAGDVGMQVSIDGLVLPGPELEPATVTDETPVIIRIDSVAPHGTDLRYDLVWVY